MFKKFLSKVNKRTKNLDYWDLKLIKLVGIAEILFLMVIWPWFFNLITSIHWGFYMAAIILFAIRPWMRFWKKRI